MIFTLGQAKDLLDFFGGADGEVAVEEVDAGGHSGHGLYAYCPDCPEEGSIILGRSSKEAQ